MTSACIDAACCRSVVTFRLSPTQARMVASMPAASAVDRKSKATRDCGASATSLRSTWRIAWGEGGQVQQPMRLGAALCRVMQNNRREA